MPQIADCPVLVLTLHLVKAVEVAAQHPLSSLTCHGPQHPVPEVDDLLQRRPDRILQRRNQQPTPHLSTLTITLSAHQKTYGLKMRG